MLVTVVYGFCGDGVVTDVGAKYFMLSQKNLLHHHDVRIVTNGLITTRNQKTAIATEVDYFK